MLRSLRPLTLQGRLLSKCEKSARKQSNREILAIVREYLRDTSPRNTHLSCKISATHTLLLHKIVQIRLHLHNEVFLDENRLIIAIINRRHI